MALGINTESGSGNFVPYSKWDARSGRWYKKNPEPGGSDIDITNNFAAIFDFSGIQVGWLAFAAGMAPSMVLAPIGQPMPPKPSDDHRQGFRMRIWLAKDLGGGEHEVAATSKALLGAIDKLHDEYLKGAAAHPGHLPVVAMTGATAIETETPKGKTRNFAPNFQIVLWAAWPGKGADAGSSPAVAPAPVAVPQPAVTAADFG